MHDRKGNERLQGLECRVGDEHHMGFDCSAMDDVRVNVPGVQDLIQHAGGPSCKVTCELCGGLWLAVWRRERWRGGRPGGCL